MRPRCGITAILAIILGLIATEAWAAGNREAKIMLHGLAPIAKAACTREALRPSFCSGFVTNNLALLPETHFAYVLVVNGSVTEGVAGAQFGIDYPGPANGAGDGAGLEIYGWTRCATLDFQTPEGGGINTWPNPNSGILVTWDAVNACQTTGYAVIGAVAVAGYFYCGAYEPTRLRIVPRQVDGQAKVANCASVEDIVYHDTIDAFTFLGAIGFGQPGINPCGIIGCFCSPVEAATWSGVKTLLDQPN